MGERIKGLVFGELEKGKPEPEKGEKKAPGGGDRHLMVEAALERTQPL